MRDINRLKLSSSVLDYEGNKVRNTTCDPFEELTCNICCVRIACENQFYCWIKVLLTLKLVV